MNNRIRNRIYAVIIFILGAVTVPIEWDVTFFAFSTILSIVMFLSKEIMIDED